MQANRLCFTSALAITLLLSGFPALADQHTASIIERPLTLAQSSFGGQPAPGTAPSYGGPPAPPAYGVPAGTGQFGFGGAPPYGGQPGSGGQSGYGAPPAGGQQGFGGSPGFPAPPGYGGQGGPGTPPIAGQPPSAGSPMYGGQPGVGGQSGYGAPPAQQQPGFGGSPTFGGQSSFGGQPGYGGQPGAAQMPPSGAPSYGGQPGGAQMPSGAPAYGGQPGYGGQPSGGQSGGGAIAAIEAMERQDFGVPATPQLHQGPMHGPTPASIPGARLITTAELARMMNSPSPPVLVDVLGGQPHPSLPGALQLPAGGMGGNFNDQNQAQLAGALRQATRGDTSRPVVLFCLSPQCWLSYNATLRAKQAGYQQALWYRGGLESWSAAGLPMAPPGTGTATR